MTTISKRPAAWRCELAGQQRAHRATGPRRQYLRSPAPPSAARTTTALRRRRNPPPDLTPQPDVVAPPVAVTMSRGHEARGPLAAASHEYKILFALLSVCLILHGRSMAAGGHPGFESRRGTDAAVCQVMPTPTPSTRRDGRELGFDDYDGLKSDERYSDMLDWAALSRHSLSWEIPC